MTSNTLHGAQITEFQTQLSAIITNALSLTKDETIQTALTMLKTELTNTPFNNGLLYNNVADEVNDARTLIGDNQAGLNILNVVKGKIDTAFTGASYTLASTISPSSP